jgi:hypothetical protein
MIWLVDIHIYLYKLEGLRRAVVFDTLIKFKTFGISV